jgi:hypothetical protein
MFTNSRVCTHRGFVNQNLDSRKSYRGLFTIGGAHQQASERAAPPVSVEEKGKTTGEKRKLLLFLLMSKQN